MTDKNNDVSWAWTLFSAIIAGAVAQIILTLLCRAFPVLREDQYFGWIAGMIVGPLVVGMLWLRILRIRRRKDTGAQNQAVHRISKGRSSLAFVER